MSFIDWKTSVDPKVRGSWNLHSLLPTGLDFFIMLSSVSGIIGNPGQSNYAAGNTFLDALARYRVSRGERAVALDLGALLGHGVLAEDDTLRDRLLKGGLLVGISPALMFGLLDYYCDPKRGLLSEEDSQVAIGLAPPSRLRSKASNNPSSSINLPFYGHLLSSTGAGDEEGKNAEQSAAKYRQEFLAADTLTKAGEVVSNALVERLFGDHSITAASGNVDFGKPMHDHGVDSLMAIELRAWLAREFAADVPIFEILGEGSWAALGVSVALKSRLWGSKVAEAA